MRCGILKSQNPIDVCYYVIVTSDSYAMKGAQSAPMRFKFDICACLTHIIEGLLVVVYQLIIDSLKTCYVGRGEVSKAGLRGQMGDHVFKTLATNPNIHVRAVQDQMQKQFDVGVSKMIAFRAKRIATDKIVSFEKGNTSTGQCYNCGGKGHYARNCPKLRVRDSKYFMEKMLLAKQDEAGVILFDEQNDFLFADASRME
ncbi:retrovirus-related pol polyprotein from transposon TNT 1-94 [Tanacetum coccineum]